MVCRLNSCCGCGDLRTGTIIVGGLYMLGSVLVVYIVLPGGPHQYEVTQSVKITGILLYLGMIAASIIMIIGGVKKNWKLIVPWLVLDGIVIGLQFIGFAILGFLLMAFYGIDFVYLGKLLIYTVISIYLWYVPFSYHLILRDESKTPVDNTNIKNPDAVYAEAPLMPPKYCP